MIIQQPLGALLRLGATDTFTPEQSKRDMTRDLVSAGVAIALPVAYHYGAPKKWPRPNLIVGLGTTVGLYFATNWGIKKWQERRI